VQTSQYVELQSVPTTGGLEVRSDPPRARVLVNGQARGSTPLVLSDLPPGDHEVVLDAGGGQQVKQFVRIEPGVTAQLVVPLRR
jgi:PEGA domain